MGNVQTLISKLSMRVTVAIVVSLIIGTGLASAAALGITPGNIGSGVASVSSCQSTTLELVWGIHPTTIQLVDDVTVKNIDTPACDGQILRVQAPAGTGPVAIASVSGASEITMSFPVPLPNVSDINSVTVTLSDE